MNNNKQNSIDWLIEQFYANEGMITTKQLEQAKAMHKEEIKKAWDNAAIDATYGNKFKNFEDYYNETFGGNNEQ